MPPSAREDTSSRQHMQLDTNATRYKECFRPVLLYALLAQERVLRGGEEAQDY